MEDNLFTGAIPSPKDYRDIGVAQAFGEPEQLPKYFYVDKEHLAVFNQRKLGACVGHAFAKYKQSLDYEDIKEVRDLSPRYLYAMAKAQDGYSDEGCFDTETELLTTTGWVNYKTATSKHLFATYNLANGLLEWQQANEIQFYNKDEQMVSLSNQSIDLLTTQKHRSVVIKQNRNKQTTETKVVAALEMMDMKTDYLIPTSIKGYVAKNSYSDEFIKLAAWIFTEGHYDKFQTRITITQTERKYKQEIVDLLNRLGYNFSINKRGDTDCYNLRIKVPHCKEVRKLLPNFESYRDFVLGLDSQQNRLFIDECIKGDGWFCTGYTMISQKNRQMAEILELSAILGGYSTHLRKRSNRQEYTLSVLNRKSIHIGRTVKKLVHYKGIVWCPSVDNTTVIARRNGKVWISGQTYPRLVAKILKDKGCATEYFTPNDTLLKHEEYVYNRDVATIPQGDAQMARIGSYAFADITLDGLKQAIIKGRGVSLLVQVGEEWFTSKKGYRSWKEKDILPLRPPAQVISGHQVFVYGYNGERFYFINSWGDTWGDKGVGYFDWSTYKKFVIEGITIVDIPNKLLEEVHNLPEKFTFQFTKDLQFGDKSDDVSQLQRFLKLQGFYNYSITGYYGDITRRAVFAFQKANNVTTLWENISYTGRYVGPKTRTFINKLTI